METKCTIPVVFGMDRKYLLPSFVTMYSILKNSESCFKFILISADDIADEVKLLQGELEKRYLNFQLQFIKIDSNFFESCQIHNSHLSLAAYNRLLIPKIVTGYEKCIYLDCDIIVNGDLKELFDFDIGENYVAGVKDCHVIQNNRVGHKKILGVDSLAEYINSGVLLLNLKKLHRDNMLEKFLQQAQEENLYEDQDVINKCCKGKIASIPLKYNLFHFYLGKGITDLFELPYELSDFDFDWDNPVIVHMGDVYKPWNSYKFKGSQYWWELADFYKDTIEYKKYKEKLQNSNIFIFEIEKIISICREAKGVVIWGFTDYGRKIFDILDNNGVDNVIGFGDSNTELKGVTYRKKNVYTLESLKGIDDISNIVWLISCKTAYKTVIKQLLDQKIAKKNIIGGMFCCQKKLSYYRALSPQFYEEELKEIALSEGLDLKYIKQVINNSQPFLAEYRYLKRAYSLGVWICRK